MKYFIYILSFFFISCSSYKVKTYYDEFDHYEWFRFENNIITEDYLGIDIEINPQKWVQGETVIYSLQIILKGKDELNIEEGYSLLLSMDDQRINLGNDVNKSFRKNLSNKKVYEEAWFEVDEDILYNLAFSENCKFKINGTSEFIKGEFSDFNKTTFKEFYRQYIDDSLWEIPTYIEELNETKFGIKISTNTKPKTSLYSFSEILSENGWTGEVVEVDWDYHLNNVSFIQKLDIGFEIPLEASQYFYPKFEIFEIMYSEQNKVPLVTKNEFQNYTCSKCPNTFPINEFNFLFPNLSNLEIKNLANWSVFRRKNDVYLVIGEENKNQVDDVFGYIVEYFQSETKTDIKLIKDRIQKEYFQLRQDYESQKVIQLFLKENGFYLGKVDGLFGKESRKSLQKFLKSKDFYNGEINGEKNIILFNSIIDYQKFLKIEQTGWINFEMADKIIK